MTNKQKKFAALAPPRNKITKADRIVGATGKPYNNGQRPSKMYGGGMITPRKPMMLGGCLLYTSPSPRDVEESRMPSSA